jgi:DNA primase
MIYDHEIKTIALCLDNDKAGKEVTDSMQSVVGNSGLDIKLKQAALPDRIKDPDQMTKERSTEAFKAVINEATVLSKTLE